MDPAQSNSVYFFSNLSRLIKKFEEFFSHSKNQSHIDDLYYLFGAVNFAYLQSCFTPNLQNKMAIRAIEIEKRFSTIWVQFLNSLQNQTLINPQLVEKAGLYQQSAFGGVNPRELMIQELSHYFLSRPMPLQECKTLNCYEIKSIKDHVDKHVEDLARIVKILFKLSPRRMNPILRELNQLDYFVMFRSSALMFQGNQFSWGGMVYHWAKSNGNALVVAMIENAFVLEKLFINTKYSSLLLPQPNFTLTFKQFVIESTLYLFFKSTIAPLPDVEIIQQDLRETFSTAGSDEERENCIYFVDSVVLWTGKEFAFEVANKSLQSLQNVQDGCVHNFLHAVVHYFHALSVLKIKDTPECKKMLLEAIYAVPLLKRKLFDKKIAGEKYFPAGFLIDEYTLSFIRSHRLPLEKWGEAFLRFSQTSFTSSPSPNLSAKEHLILVQKIESFTGLPLPTELIADLFFFQKIKKGALELVESFEAFRQTIFNHYLDTISIPKMSLNAMQNLFKAFVELFESPILIFEDGMNEYKGRNDRFLRNASQLTSILHMMLNPKSFVLFEDLMPESLEILEDKGISIKLNKMGSDAIKKLQLFNPSYPTGPLWMGRWEKRDKDIYFSISIVRSFLSMRTCTFSLKLPSDLSSHLSLLKQHVDKNTSIEFVRLLRSFFLKSFYRVMLGSKAPEGSFASELCVLFPFKDGFYLKKPVEGTPMQETDLVRYSDYANFLSEIYVDWRTSESDDFASKIKISPDLITLRIVTERVLDEENMLQETFFITLNLPLQDHALTVKYPQFKDKETFILMMVWQLALLKNPTCPLNYA